MTATMTDIQQLSINTIRTLSMDAVQAANSGHPGTPMALAPVAYQLWNHHLKYDPANPNWPARDRFVLSCGHASMLQYSVLHLANVRKQDGSSEPSISIDDIKNFRQLHSPCAGHPEYGMAAGIETTTGPLGQGIANSVGMAISARWMSAHYGQDSSDLFDFDVYALCSDGDVMEGIGGEAASLAGHLKLSNLCWIYDDNRITIEGSTDLAFSEQAAVKFTSMGWNVVTVEDANDLAAIDKAFENFKRTNDAPTLIILRSIIGYGAPNKQNTAGAHGSPLGEDEIAAAKKFYQWNNDRFVVPDEVLEDFAEGIGQRGAAAYRQWQSQWEQFSSSNAKLADEINMIWQGKLPGGWENDLPEFPADEKGLATRKASGKVINAIGNQIPWLIGGSADLAGSNNSIIDEENGGHFSANDYAGRNFHFGVREHAMAAVCNGMALYGIRSYAATFFVFTDYMRPSMRLAALMKQNVLYILTHDSIGLGEDGPTHQPVEHLSACRAIPNLAVFRPADANEVTHCYQAAIGLSGQPAAMVLSRQNIPTIDRQQFASAAGAQRGGYVVHDVDNPQVILMGTGSELQMCLDAAEKLAKDGIAARVVSLPCFEVFDQQDAAYVESVLPSNLTARVAVEAGIRQSWDKYLLSKGKFVGMNGFGESAPHDVLYREFGITVEAVVTAASQAVKETS